MSLEDLRIQIDAIDTQIIRLLNERCDFVHEIGLIKKKEGLEIYAPEREEKLLRSLSRGKCAARNNMGSVGLREDENVLWGGVDTEDAAPFGL